MELNTDEIFKHFVDCEEFNNIDLEEYKKG